MNMCRTLLVIAIVVLEIIQGYQEDTHNVEDIPLSKSLGFKINLNKTLYDKHIENEYLYLYNEMLKASQDSSTNILTKNDNITRLQGRVHPKRGARMQSPAGQRRARSQALRREKLNSQSLRSHMEHSRRHSVEEKIIKQ